MDQANSFAGDDSGDIEIASGLGGREIDDRRHNVNRSARSAVPAGVATLCDENISARIQRLPRHVFVLDLADQERAGSLDARRKRLGTAERKHDRARARVQRDIEKLGLLCQTPGDEPDAERHCASLELSGLLLQPGSFAVAAAENSKAARTADRTRETCAGNQIHWGREDRMLDAQKR